MLETELADVPGVGIQLGNDRAAVVTDTNSGRACIEAVLECEPQEVFELLTDYENLPSHIVGLQEATFLGKANGASSVQFTMKLPFPIGRVCWTNLIEASECDGTYKIEWSLVEGDLSACNGSIVLAPAEGLPRRTKASYQIHVSQKSRIPKRAERMAVNWLLPRVVRRLCAKLESAV
tara:strand:- start:63481 stop:64014 length:534 start_codon:yes stop_codon:yes gene_type:complete